MSSSITKVPYGACVVNKFDLRLTSRVCSIVRLGNSGLKVSKIILGCMSYGSPEWQDWVIGDEQEVFKHIKYAYDHGIQTFDTANVCSWRSAIQVGY